MEEKIEKMAKKIITVFTVFFLLFAISFFGFCFWAKQKNAPQVKHFKAEKITEIIETEVPKTEAPCKWYAIPLERHLVDFTLEKCKEYEVEPELIFAIMKIESDFNVNAVNKSCIGLMQINFNKYPDPEAARNSLSNPAQNIEVGIKMISELTKKYPIERALVIYNCGLSGSKGREYSTYSIKVLRQREEYRQNER